MKFCSDCQVTIVNHLDCCPLCGRPLTESQGPCVETFPVVPYSKPAARWMRRLWLTMLVALAGSILLDLSTSHSFWYVVAAVGCMAVGFGFLSSLKSKENRGYTVLKHVVLLSVISVALDFWMSFSGWSVGYVIPFLVIAGSFFITLIIVVRPKWFQDYFMYQVSLCVLCALTLLLRLTGISPVGWTATAAFVYSLVTMLGLFLFFGRRSLHEIHKRLHI